MEEQNCIITIKTKNGQKPFHASVIVYSPISNVRMALELKTGFGV